MRHGGDVDDLGHDDARVVDGPDSGLTACAGALHISLDLAETGVISGLGSILGCHLGGVRSVLLGAPEAALSGRRPADDLALGIGKGNDNVVEGR